MKRDGDASRPWAVKLGTSERSLARLAKANRSRPTDAESRLWRLLRELPLDGTHFRRQVVIGGYIADFACRKAMLVIEVDGGQHCDNDADLRRTRDIEQRGWRVLRFWNNDVLLNPRGVGERIMEALGLDVGAPSGTTPTPDPSPQGGGEKGGAFPDISGEARP